MVNRKFFDTILVFNEYELLEERIKLLENKVDKFIIFDFGDGCKNFSSEKIIHVKAPKFFLENNIDLIYEAIKYLDPKSLYVEDVLMFSRVNEIPDMETLFKNVDLFDIMPIVFKQKKVFWESNKLSNKYHYRAFALMYTHFIKTKNLYDSLLSLKTPIPVNRLTLDCGWELNGYQKKDDNVASLEFWQGKKIDLKNFIRLHKEQKDFDNNPLITEKSGLPKVFVKHQTQEKARKAKKIILTEDINLFENSSESILLVEKGKIRSNENFNYNFVIPSTQYYDSVDFGEAYSKNETLKVLSLLGFLPHDIITYYKKETLDKVSITYREFVESIPSELF
jgi:hypothetical protein